MNMPWEKPTPTDAPLDPLLIRNPITGLLPGQRDELDLPEFLRAVPRKKT